MFTASGAQAIQLLLSLIEDYNMVMLLLKDILMVQSMVTKNWTHVDNVFASTNVEPLIVICDMDPRQRGLGTDHIPVLMTLDIPIPQLEESTCRDFRGMNWEEFRKELETHLSLILEPCPLLRAPQFQRAIADLTQALQNAINIAVPVSQPSPHSCQWWSKDLTHLKRLMNWVASQAYKFHTVTDHASHEEY